MKHGRNGRNHVDVLSIERCLGLKSERGISRQGNKDSPPIENILKGVKNIMVAYVNTDLAEIRSSDALRDDATRLVDKYGPEIWPGPDQPRPQWLETASADRYDGKYPQDRYYTNADDKEYLRDLFLQLVVEKVCNYHENQLQKRRRQTNKMLEDQLQPEPEELITDNSKELHHSPETEAPQQPAFVDKAAAFREQFAAYTQPVPTSFVPHGLPSSGGSYAHASDSRPGSLAPSDVSRKRLPSEASHSTPAKRRRRERDPYVPSESQPQSLAVRLKVSRDELAQLRDTGSVSTQLPTAESAEEPTTNGDDTPTQQDTIRVGIPRTHIATPISAYQSPYRQMLPYEAGAVGAEDRHDSPLNVAATTHRATRSGSRHIPVDLTMEDDSPTNDHDPATTAMANEILGPLATCPSVIKLMSAHPQMEPQKFHNLRDILEQYPKTKTSVTELDKVIRALAEESNSRNQSGPPPMQWSPLPASSSLIRRRRRSAHQPKPKPGPKPEEMLVRTKKEPVVQPTPDATPQPHTQLKDEPKVEPKAEPTETREGLSGRSLDNIPIEIIWGQQLDYTDIIDMQECDSVTELFGLVEARRPEELQDDVIKEIRIKSNTEGLGVLPRVVRDENRGRPAIRHLVKKLKAQPAEKEIELIFNIFWEAATQ